MNNVYPSSNIENNSPKKAVIENFFIFRGALNLILEGSNLYLNLSAEAFTKANVTNIDMFARFATISIFLKNMKIDDNRARVNIANQGVFVFEDILLNFSGNTPSLAKLEVTLDVATNAISTVFNVENKAIIAKTKNAIDPRDIAAVSANGALLKANFSCPIIDIADIAVSTYRTVVIIIDSINAFGIFFLGCFVSSDSFTISSNPMYAKNISAAAWSTPLNPKLNSRRFTVPQYFIPKTIMINNPITSKNVAKIVTFVENSIPVKFTKDKKAINKIANNIIGNPVIEFR